MHNPEYHSASDSIGKEERVYVVVLGGGAAWQIVCTHWQWELELPYPLGAEEGQVY